MLFYLENLIIICKRISYFIWILFAKADTKMSTAMNGCRIAVHSHSKRAIAFWAHCSSCVCVCLFCVACRMRAMTLFLVCFLPCSGGDYVLLGHYISYMRYSSLHALPLNLCTFLAVPCHYICKIPPIKIGHILMNFDLNSLLRSTIVNAAKSKCEREKER